MSSEGMDGWRMRLGKRKGREQEEGGQHTDSGPSLLPRRVYRVTETSAAISGRTKVTLDGSFEGRVPLWRTAGGTTG